MNTQDIAHALADLSGELSDYVERPALPTKVLAKLHHELNRILANVDGQLLPRLETLPDPEEDLPNDPMRAMLIDIRGSSEYKEFQEVYGSYIDKVLACKVISFAGETMWWATADMTDTVG